MNNEEQNTEETDNRPIGKCESCGHLYYKSGPCHHESCRYWIPSEKFQNCTFLAIEENGPMTLREVAELVGISHVGVKFIEERALEKIRKKAKNNEKYEINIDLLRD